MNRKRRNNTWIILTVGLLCGCGLGLAKSWARFGRSSENDTFTVSMTADYPELDPPPPGMPQPHAVVAEDSFDFGDIELNSTREHKFLVTNTGSGELRLRKGGTTCSKCTVNDLPKDRLQPGESEEITVTYHGTSNGPFRQTASIVTNDAALARIPLVISGNVAATIQVSPADIVFTRLATDESATAEVRVLVSAQKPLEITGHDFLDADSAAHFKLDMQPLEAAQLGTAHSGMLLRITVLPGLPVGPLRQKLRLTTNQEQSPTLEIPIQGTVRGDISIIGQDWDSDRGTLAVGLVDGAVGLRRQLYVLVRGPHRQDVHLKLAERVPEFVQVEIGTPEEVNQGSTVKIPLTIVIPPGSPGVNHMGTAQGSLGKLVFETGHPLAGPLRIFLQFYVEN